MRRATQLLLIILMLAPLVFGSAPNGAMMSPAAAERTRPVLSVAFALTGMSPERESHAEEGATIQRSSRAALNDEIGEILPIECESNQACSACTLCQACHPAALLDELTSRFAFSPAQAPPLHIATVFSGIDRSPHLKPPIL